MRTDDRAHYTALAALMNEAGQPPATAADIDFSYPKGSFRSAGSVLALASRVSTLALGAYLGALQDVQTPELRLPLGQIAANEAQHVGALDHLRGRPAIGAAFARSLQIDAASAALGEYES
jgi:Ferritin-like domain